MPNVPITPSSIAPPAARYHLGVVVPSGASTLFTAGIVGERPDGSISDDIGEQAAEVWRSVGAILTEAGFAVGDIVTYTTYAVVGHDLSAVMASRDRFLGDHLAASVLIPVPALAKPSWKVEISLVAAH
jgi:enamine deaminase RidA (YjgF/YER057c/UK114 family)